MKKKQIKPIQNILKHFKELMGEEEFNLFEIPTKKDLLKNKYKHSIGQAKSSKEEHETIEKLKIRTGNYSLRTKIKKNPWIKDRPASHAVRWMFKEVFKNPSVYKYNKMLFGQGQLFTFEYKNPKYKDTDVLPYFDQYPLVISLGPITTNQGIRNLGFNLHLLPPKIRIIVLCAIFEYSKRAYRYQIFLKQNKPVHIDYKIIVKGLKRYGVQFAIRMYIPQRTRQIVCFPFKDWHKAIFFPSKGYYGIKANKLVDAWKKYCREQGISVTPNIDWQSKI